MTARHHELLLGEGISDLTIEQFLEHLPQQSGVYLMYDASERVMYVGKAKDLSKRVRSYFREPGGRSVKEAALLGRLARLECVLTETEVEALVLEASLIKHHRPRYNVYLKDDKSYPYIRVSQEAYPRIRKTRTIVRDGSRYYGPFTSVRDMSSLLHTASRVFFARSCNDTLPFPPHRRECLDYHIGRCLAPCTERISRREYAAMIEQAEQLLTGNSERLAGELETQMLARSEELDFERAAVLRDQIRGIKRVAAAQRAVSDKDEDLDVVVVAERPPLSLAVVLEVRRGRLIGRKAHRLSFVDTGSQAGTMEAFVQQFYLGGGRDLPPTILVNLLPASVAPLAEALSATRGHRVRLFRPQRGERRRLVEMAESQAQRLLHEHSLSGADESAQNALRDLAVHLDLDAPPARIEAFDISHVQGTNVVAGMVVFCDGVAERSEYRRFRIRGEHGNDDFASMRETVARRYQRVRAEGLEPPALILIDGGRGQLGAALNGLEAAGMAGLQANVVALAKKLEQVFRPGVPEPLPIPPASPGHLLLRRIRDEVHRYAVTYHRSLRTKASLESQIDAVPGVGRERRKKLLTRFGSAAAIEAAGFAAVAAVPGIGPVLARKILLHLSGRTDATEEA